ncbi:MAG: hypothetical protein U0P45_09770 [Acidimicrobiales bacterium]
MRRFVIVAVLGLAALVVSGCSTSGSDASDGGDKADTTEATAKTTTSKPKDATTTTSSGGSSQGGADREAYVTALATGLSSGDKDTDLVLGEDEASCVAEKWIDAITVATLQDQDVDPKDVAEPGWDTTGFGLSKAQGGAMVDAFDPCGVDIYDELASALSGGFTDAQIACVRKEIDRDLARELLVVTFAGGEGTTEFEALIGQLTEACNLPPD